MKDFSYLLYSNVHREFPRVSYFVMFFQTCLEKKSLLHETPLLPSKRKQQQQKNCLLWKTFSRTSQVNVINYIPGVVPHHVPTS